MLFSLRRLAAGFAAVILTAQIAAAAEIKVYSTIGVKSALEDLAPKFEKATGNKLNITWGLISGFVKKAQEGDVPDVLIVSRAGIDSLTKDGKIAAGGVTLGKSIFAFGVKQGAPKPDISTVDAMKKTLLVRARGRLHRSGRRRRERRLFLQDDREARHRRGDQGQEQISATRRLRRHAADQWRSRYRLPEQAGTDNDPGRRRGRSAARRSRPHQSCLPPASAPRRRTARPARRCSSS